MGDSVRSIVVGTAGHIDHGKSSLVLALTGTDPDRLKEEKARGITIDLGFAHARVGDVNVAFVDVPGHERFVKNMLAGVGGIDAVLLVIAADESVMPQTREHFAICRLLQIPAGIVVLTKADLVDADTLELARVEARDLDGVRVDEIGLGQGNEAGADAQQAADVEVLPGLRLHRLVSRDYQHDEVDAADAGKHVLHEALVPRHVHERHVDPFDLRVGEPEVDGDPARLLFLQPIRIGAGQRLDERALAMVDVSRRADDDGTGLVM